jgi:chorismate dehydratase
VLLRRAYGAAPDTVAMAPDLDAMLARADAALIIGDNALFLDPSRAAGTPGRAVRKIDLGELWTETTGLPFVYAVWAGWRDALTPEDVVVLQRARDQGVADSDGVADAYYPGEPGRQAAARRYLRDNIRYVLGEDELEGLRTFYRYAGEIDLVSFDGSLRFY